MLDFTCTYPHYLSVCSIQFTLIFYPLNCWWDFNFADSESRYVTRKLLLREKSFLKEIFFFKAELDTPTLIGKWQGFFTLKLISWIQTMALQLWVKSNILNPKWDFDSLFLQVKRKLFKVPPKEAVTPFSLAKTCLTFFG